MKERIDPLIAERAPWLFADRPGTRLVRGTLHRALSYDRTISIAETLQGSPSAEIMARMGEMLARDVDCHGLTNIPRAGAALIVSNHPTGIADGIILHHFIAPIRPDLYVMANSDILRIMPQMADYIAPVEWRKDKRSHGKTRETMAFMRRAVSDDRLGVIFPAGRLAKRRGLRLYERPWMASAAMIARKFDLPVIPVHIRARNSLLFLPLRPDPPDAAGHHAVPRDAEQEPPAVPRHRRRGDLALGPARDLRGRHRDACAARPSPSRRRRAHGQPRPRHPSSARAVLKKARRRAACRARPARRAVSLRAAPSCSAAAGRAPAPRPPRSARAAAWGRRPRHHG